MKQSDLPKQSKDGAKLWSWQRHWVRAFWGEGMDTLPDLTQNDLTLHCSVVHDSSPVATLMVPQVQGYLWY